VAFLVTAVLAGWALLAEQEADRQARRAKAGEQERTESLFDSSLTHAALLARVEDPAAARAALYATAKLAQAIAATTPPRPQPASGLCGYPGRRSGQGL